MKKVLLGFGVVLALVIAVAWFFVNEILGSAMEEAGTYAMGVDTRVGFVRLRVVPGDFRVNRLRVANPAGFDEDHFLRMRDATIKVDAGTVMQPVVVVPELRLHGITVALEQEGKQTNYGVILDNIGRFEKKYPPGTTPPPDEAGTEKRFIINRILITEVDAYVEWTEQASDYTGVRVGIPQIELKNVGAENAQGVAMAEVGNIILKAVLGSIARHGGDLPGAMLSALNGSLKGVARVPGVVVTGLGGSAADKVGEAVGGSVGEAIQGVGGDAAKSVGDAVGKEAGKALGGLFGGSDEKDEEPSGQ